jgi:hypothetical protein
MLADDLTNRLIRYPGAVAMRLRIARLRLLGVRIGRSCWIRRIQVPRNPWDIVIGAGVALDDHVVTFDHRLSRRAPAFGQVLSVLQKIRLCDPAPAAIIIHIDLSDGSLEAELKKRFPDVAVLASSARRGPGGGRHRCLLACKTPFAVSFDDDSYPVDSDFFATVERLFPEHPRAALLEANVWYRNEPELPRAASLTPIPSYIGCGYAIRLDVYRQMCGYLDRPVPYGMEEPV